MTTFQTLFEEHAAASLDKQFALSEVIGDAGWQLDLDTGTISFGPTLTFPIQILGTVSEYSNTWLWSWANTESNIPPSLIQAALQLRELGTVERMPEFSDDQLDLEQISGHEIALAAAGICQSDCYYRGPYKGGAVYVLIDAPVVRQQRDASPLRVIKVFNQLISTFVLDHRRALTAYLQQKGYTLTETRTSLEATAPDRSGLRATFDTHGRLVEINTSVSGAA